MSDFDRRKRTRVRKMSLPQKNRGESDKAKSQEIVDLGRRGGYRGAGAGQDYKKVSNRHAAEPQSLDDVESLDRILGKVVKIGGFSLLFLGLIALSIFGYIQLKNREQVVPPEAVARVENQGKFGIDLAKMDAALIGFLEAKTIDERSQYIRNPEHALPLMETFYEGKDAGPLAYEAAELRVGVVRETYSGNGQVFCTMVVNLEGFKQRELAMEVKDGAYLVDWESFVGYSDLPFEKFVENRVKKPTLMRFMAMRDDYYNFGFADSEQYGCLRLEPSHLEGRVYGYYERGTELEKRIDRAFKQFEGSERIYVIVRVMYPETGKGKRQVLIEEIVSNSWVEMEGRDLSEDSESKLDVLLSE